MAILVLCALLPACTRPQPTASTPVGLTHAATQPADNYYCLTCHANFTREKLAVSHAKNGVGCVTCHGESAKHSSDEDGLTPPQIMFPRERISMSCLQCHKDPAKPAAPGLASAVACPRGTPAAKPGSVCTDCHGEHRMATRTRRWDKFTGKLLSDDGVRMVAPMTQPKK